MSGRILGKNRLHVVSAAQHLPSLPASDIMSVLIQENGLLLVIYAMQGLIIDLVSYTTSVLILAKNLLNVLYVAVALGTIALATVIRSAVDVLGSRSTRSA